MMQIM